MSKQAQHEAHTLLDRAFLDALTRARPNATTIPTPPRPPAQLEALFEDQALSRHLDFAARRLRADGRGYYTISSAGHEGNAYVAAATRADDPALLHYRSGAFFLHRARQAGRLDVALRSVLQGLVAARDEPIAGGRHKVFGSVELNIPPQTSTIASHLPKAVGMAFALRRSARLARDGLRARTPTPPEDAIVVCSFGDASANHSTAAGAINSACHIAHQGLPLPLLLVCEDNGLGISVRTPAGWVRAAYGARPGLEYFHADTADARASWAAARAAAQHVRLRRRPALLHLRCARFLGHAGSDVELAYRTPEELRRERARDPLLATARALITSGSCTKEQILEGYERARARVDALAQELAESPGLASAAEIIAPLAPRDDEAIAAARARALAPPERRRAFWGERLPEREGPVPLARHLNFALGDLLAADERVQLFGEDVGRKGGVYGITRGLQRRAGLARVFDTLLDEQTILGLAIGAAQLGLMPIPEIQYLAYLHNAIDQLRGEAASLQFFSRAQLQNPMVVRIASFAALKGFGGHFHNDNAVAALREIPGLVIAAPSTGRDAAATLRTCVAAARACGSVCVLLEPIALYQTRDLHEPGDGAYAEPYDPRSEAAPIGAPRIYGDGRDLLIISFASGVYMSRRVARRLARRGIACTVLDLRWLAPLPVDAVLEALAPIGRALVVDETRRTGGVSEGVIAGLIDRGFRGPLRRVTAEDSFVPLGAAARHVLLSEAAIEAAAVEQCATPGT